MASRQSRAVAAGPSTMSKLLPNQLVQRRSSEPTRGSARKTAKVTPAVNCLDSGFVVGMPGGGVYEPHSFSVPISKVS